MEIKNKLTVTRGEKGEDGGGRMGRVKSRNTYEGPMDKAWGRIEGGRWGWLGQRRVLKGGGGWRQLYLKMI